MGKPFQNSFFSNPSRMGVGGIPRWHPNRTNAFLEIPFLGRSPPTHGYDIVLFRLVRTWISTEPPTQSKAYVAQVIRILQQEYLYRGSNPHTRKGGLIGWKQNSKI